MPDKDQRPHLHVVKNNRKGVRTPVTVHDPIAEIERDHSLQLELCDMLEHLADGLPDNSEPSLAKISIIILRNGIPAHTALEGNILFPALRCRCRYEPGLIDLIENLQEGHRADEGFFEEVADELEHFVEQGRSRNAEMLGYMLRGFFISQRRYIAWENLTIVPAARRLLTDADRCALSAAMEENHLIKQGRMTLSKIPVQFKAPRGRDAAYPDKPH